MAAQPVEVVPTVEPQMAAQPVGVVPTVEPQMAAQPDANQGQVYTTNGSQPFDINSMFVSNK